MQQAFPPLGKNVTAHFYVHVLQMFSDAVRREPHIACCAATPRLEEGSVIHHRTPNSPDLAPNAFWLFPSMKMGFKGTRFATVEEIKRHSSGRAKFRKLDMSRSSGEWLQIHNLLATSKKIWYCREL
jgi:hypothetical protein